jgi:hypothetical protein
MAAYMFLLVKRQAREVHRQLGVQSLANSGEAKEINKTLERLEKEAG